MRSFYFFFQPSYCAYITLIPTRLSGRAILIWRNIRVVTCGVIYAHENTVAILTVYAYAVVENIGRKKQCAYFHLWHLDPGPHQVHLTKYSICEAVIET